MWYYAKPFVVCGAIAIFCTIQERFAEYAAALDGKAPAADRKKAFSELQAAIRNAAPNVAYAAKTLDEHIEKVVETARTDVENMVVRMAEQRGVPVADVKAIGWGETRP